MIIKVKTLFYQINT